ADRQRVFRAPGVASAALPPLPASPGAVRSRPGLAFPAAAAHSHGPPAAPARELGQRPRHQCGDRRAHRDDGADDGAARVPARLSAGRPPRRHDRRLAVLRPTSVRGDLLGRRSGLVIPGGGARGRLVLRPAAPAPLGDRLYRLPSYPPFVEPDPELPAARLLHGESRAAPGQAPRPAGQRPLRTADAMGRDIAPIGVVPRRAPARARGELASPGGAAAASYPRSLAGRSLAPKRALICASSMYMAPSGFLIAWTMQPSRKKCCARSSAPASVCALATFQRATSVRRSVSHQMSQANAGLPAEATGSGRVARLTKNLARLVPYFDRVMLRIVAQHLERCLLRIAVAAAFDEFDDRDQASLVHQIAAICAHLVFSSVACCDGVTKPATARSRPPAQAGKEGR